jgi:hypothetical protein
MNYKKWLQHGLFLLMISLVGIQASWADQLDDAKAQGLVGEKANGYLGLVVSDAPAAVKQLVDSINSKRKQKYQEVANARNIALSQVEAIAGKKAIEKTLPGHYIEVNGRWVKK